MRAAGLEVWFDQSELAGGDAWDAKIRQQIGACALFAPIISAATQARAEGYFRLEWRLAAQRTHMMSERTAFLLPIVIDATGDAEADVPAEFKAVQWTRLPAGMATPDFVAQVQRLLTAPRAATAPTAPVALQPVPVRIETLASPRVRRWSWSAPAVALGALAVGYFLLNRSHSEPDRPAVETRPAPAALDPKSIAVLAFKNLSADKDDGYFSDGLSVNIGQKLAGTAGLRVIGTTSSFSYKGRDVPATQIGRELRTGTIVDGSVQRLGTRLRVTAQLVNAADGTQVWSETFDKELTTTDMFAVQDEIALKIAARLSPSAVAVARVATTLPTQNLAAYDAFLRGRELFAQTSPSWNRAAKEFESAIELDPKFALAWALLGSVQASLYAFDYNRNLESARQAIEEAERLQPGMPEVQLARARLISANGTHLSAALHALDLAEKSRPNDSEITAFQATLRYYQGRRTEAIALARRGVELDPRNGSHVNQLGNILTIDGQYAGAEAAYRRAFEILGTSIPLTNLARLQLGWKGDRTLVVQTLDAVPAELRGDAYWFISQRVLYDAGALAESLAAAREQRNPSLKSPRILQIAQSAILAARASEAMGDKTEAERYFHEAAAMSEKNCIEIPLASGPRATLALAYAGLGRRDDALAMARKALELVPPGENPQGAAWNTGRTSGGLNALALVQARFGLIDEALAIVKAQAEAGWWRRNYLLLSPDWATLRKDPRFRAIAEKAPL